MGLEGGGRNGKISRGKTEDMIALRMAMVRNWMAILWGGTISKIEVHLAMLFPNRLVSRVREGKY
jgi:hypothetical protein